MRFMQESLDLRTTLVMGMVCPNRARKDGNDATVETLTVDLSGINYPDLPTNRSHTYLWRYVDADGDVFIAAPIMTTARRSR